MLSSKKPLIVKILSKVNLTLMNLSRMFMGFSNLNSRRANLQVGNQSTIPYKTNHNGNTVIIASSEDKNFSYIPKGYDIPDDLDYLHFTSNNTI